MEAVTNPELIKKLKDKKANQSKQSSLGLVTDESLIKRIKEKQKQQIKKSPVTEQEETVLVGAENPISDFFRSAVSVGSSVVAEPLAGLYGLAALAGTGGDADRAAQAVESARETLTYSPETQGAQQNLQALGEFLAPVAEGLETVSTAAGDTVYEWTGSPELAAVAYSLPTAA